MKRFGATRDGSPVFSYRLTNSRGAYAEILDYGCTLRSLCVSDREGILTDVVLGYDTVEEYEKNDGYFGACIGRFANRIGRGEFTLNDEVYPLACNDGENHLHGGDKGFDKHSWAAAVASDRLIFSRTSPHGEEGYPGNLFVSVIYSFDDHNTLTITYDAHCDSDTVINLTNHAYFNLNGQGTGSAMDLLLQVEGEEFTENDSNCLPTGKILFVQGTPFDFRTPKAVGAEIDAQDVNLQNGKGYDHNFILRGEGLRKVASLFSEKRGIEMTVSTTQPGIQVYSGNFMTDRLGKDGVKYGFRDGICLETQHFPDSVHHESFPSVVLKQGEQYHEITQYTFGNK